jgi:hypothetical protein
LDLVTHVPVMIEGFFFSCGISGKLERIIESLVYGFALSRKERT